MALNEREEFELLSLERDRARHSAAPQQDPISNWAAPQEIVGAIGSGMAGGIAGGLAGLAQGAKNLVSPGMPAGDRVRQVQGAMTYQPKGDVARMAVNALSWPFEKLAEGADWAGEGVAEASGSPALGAATNTTLQAIPMLAARAFRKPVEGALAKSKAELAATASRNSVRDATIAAGRAEGYSLPQSVANQGGSFVGNRVEGVAGKAALGQEASLRHQQVTNKVARREAGLAEDAPISEATLKNAREVMSEPYREVAALSQDAAKSLEKLKEVRAEAKDYWKHYDISGDPKSKKAAVRLDDKADVLESTIDRIAVDKGRPGLLADLKEARKNLAKNYDVERAVNLGTGDVDAIIIGRILDKRGDKGMTGGLQTVGKFAQAFPQYMRSNAPMPTPGKGEGLAAAAFGMAGHAGGMGWLPAGLPMLGGPARSIALSEMMQKPREYNPGKGLRLSDLSTRSPSANALIPLLGNRNEER